LSAGWDINTTFALWSLVVGIVGIVLGALAFMPGWTDYRDWLKDDPSYREKTATGLRGHGRAGQYRSWLEAGLEWLNRRFGEANSARSLGVCTLISLCYAWAAFFLGYSMGTPGRLGETELLPADAAPVKRLLWFAIAVVLPPITFLITRWLCDLTGRIERKVEVSSHRQRRRQNLGLSERWLKHSYRLFNISVILGLCLLLLSPLVFQDPNSWLYQAAFSFSFCAFFTFGPTVGLAIAGRIGSDCLKGPRS